MKTYVDLTAWSHGQITGKLWLAEELEKISVGKRPQRIALYGGWYATLALLLFMRDKMPIEYIRSYDKDPECEPIADKFLTPWVFDEWRFKAETVDCNDLIWEELMWLPHIVVNTSTEHFEKDDWFNNIPPGITVALMNNDQAHEDHNRGVGSLDELRERYPLRLELYGGHMDFEYPDKSYTRFLLIGKK